MQISEGKKQRTKTFKAFLETNKPMTEREICKRQKIHSIGGRMWLAELFDSLINEGKAEWLKGKKEESKYGPEARFVIKEK